MVGRQRYGRSAPGQYRGNIAKASALTAAVRWQHTFVTRSDHKQLRARMAINGHIRVRCSTNQSAASDKMCNLLILATAVTFCYTEKRVSVE